MKIIADFFGEMFLGFITVYLLFLIGYQFIAFIGE